MNNLSNAALSDTNDHFSSFKPIPTLAICILIPLFLLGLAVSVFFLIVVHNAAFFVPFVLLSSFVLAFIGWNTHNWRKKGAIFLFLRSFPDSDIRRAKEGQLVKITGVLFLSHPYFLFLILSSGARLSNEEYFLDLEKRKFWLFSLLSLWNAAWNIMKNWR